MYLPFLFFTMQKPLSVNNHLAAPEFLSGGGEMGRRIREHDWSLTSLGTVDSWPQSLRSAISICLNSNFPIAIYWGKDLTLVYNDAWSPIPGNKHPWALGKPAKEVWPEIWKDIEPQFEKTFKGQPGGSKDALLPMNRHGYIEECYFDFTFTPVYGEAGKVEGVFNAVIETTKTILNERQLQTLRELGNLDRTAKTVDEVLAEVANNLEKNNKDFPFAIIYKINEGEKIAQAVAFAGIGQAQALFPHHIDLCNPHSNTHDFCVAYQANTMTVSEAENQKKTFPKGGWDKEATHFIHLPITSQAGKPVAILTAALNPYRRLDEAYRQFVQLLADQITTEVSNVLAYEEERKRAEALAEIDKAKTAFFTNISHEFRTPLTLLLGTVEESLNDPAITPKNAERMGVTHRNAMRLLKLVNTLLDFSRLEAGKVKAAYQRTDMAAFTSNIASGFRSVIENAGLRFNVHCDVIDQAIYIDKEMWEKIVLNLLSNAFKYTLKGSIALSLTTNDNTIFLRVKDTGVGIPKAELPNMFQRFHRVQNSTGRTYEGTGIGLSLVKELVNLHGGEITVSSEEGAGTEFTVAIPTGKAHLPPAQVSEKETDVDQTITNVFLEETESLTEQLPSSNGRETNKNAPVVLVVDDNADMRRHIERLLHDQFNVVTAGNGMEALHELKQHAVDLVVSDVMMPVMDGISLMKAIRNEPKTTDIPVILVSARAGEEAKVEGYELGADDYLVKPFSAKELVARVRSQISLARKRSGALRDVYNLFDEVPFAVAVLKGEALVIDYINQYNLAVWQQAKEEVTGKPLFEARPDIRTGAEAIHREVYRSGKRFEAKEVALDIVTNGHTQTRYFNTIIDPLRDAEGIIIGQIATSIEVTDQVMARKKIEENEEKFRSTFNNAAVGIAHVGLDGNWLLVNDRICEIVGYSPSELLTKTFQHITHPDDLDADLDLVHKILRGKIDTYSMEKRYFRKNGNLVWVNITVSLVRNSNGTPKHFISIVEDISERKRTEEALKESEQLFRQFSNNITNLAWIADGEGWIYWYNQRWYDYTGMNLEQMQGWGWEKVHHPDHVNNVIAFSKEAWKKPEPFELTFPLRRSDGVYQWFLTRAVPIVNEEGTIVRWIGTNTNINEQVQLSEKLEELVEERTRELQRSNEDLQQFAHVASHDLKEPVRKIRTFSSRLKQEHEKDLPEKAATYLAKIENATERMYAMIDGVLLYSSLNATELIAEPVDLNTTLKNIEDDLEVLIAQKDAVVKRSVLPTIEGSAILLYQLFYNLIGNSLKFAKPDARPLIQIGAEIEKSEGKNVVQITVSDNGIGFHPQNAERIFQTFFRLNPKDMFEGTGLGLALCKKIVERHGGTIHAEGKEGEGATFVIQLPINKVKKSLS